MRELEAQARLAEIIAEQAALTQGIPDTGRDALSLVHFRPSVRGQCAEGYRPCPYMSCRYHLGTDVLRNGSLRFPHGHEPADLETMPQTCALDVADGGGSSAEDVGAFLGLSAKRVARLEQEAARKLGEAMIEEAAPALFDRLPLLRKRAAAKAKPKE